MRSPRLSLKSIVPFAASVLATAVFAASLMASDPPKQAVDKQDFRAIQGTWKTIALESDGEQAPAEVVATLKFVFKDEQLTLAPGEPGFTKYNYKLDPTRKPASFDMTHADGTHKGETQKGIYILEGDSLRICFGSNEGRPKELTAKMGSGQLIYTLKREKQ